MKITEFGIRIVGQADAHIRKLDESTARELLAHYIERYPNEQFEVVSRIIEVTDWIIDG